MNVRGASLINQIAAPLWIFLLAASGAAAATDDAADATAVVDEAELVVTALDSGNRVRPPRVDADADFLIERQPRSVAEMLRFLPGVATKTNSRGETVARVRGAEERQTQVFLDGAPLAVPWDGRADLGVLPAGLVSTIEVAKGAVPIEYGPNAVAGAIDFRTGARTANGIEGMAQLGSNGFRTASIVGAADTGPTQILLAASHVGRDAEPVADYDAVPFSQARGGGRTNTDLSSTSLFGAVGITGPGIAARASLLHVASQRGIAPESDRDPQVAAPRFWRYPAINLTQLTLAGSADLGPVSSLRVVAWQQWFDQSIESFGDANYRNARARQDDDDTALGGRIVVSTALAPFDLRLVGSAQTARHGQVETDLAGNVVGPRLVYRQNLFTLGAELDAPLGPARATFGVAYDRAATPLTGDKPAQPTQDALAFSVAAAIDLDANTTLSGSGGRRTRFASARELYGEALGRFLLNPDLRPETAWLADLELSWRSAAAAIVINPFYVRGRDTIAQRVVKVNGASLRQRYNQSGTRVLGIDAEAKLTLSDTLDAEMIGTAMSALADAGDAPFRRMLQRPAYEIAGALRFRPIDMLLLRAEYRRVGPAVDLDAVGNRVDLAAGDEINLRGTLAVAQVGGSTVSITLAVDNLTNAVISPQPGLPLPGRMLRMGVRVD